LAEAKDQLARVKDELARSTETETCLRKCVNNLTVYCDDAQRTSTDVALSQPTECTERQLMAEQLESIINDLKEFNIRVQEECQSVTENWNAMKMEHERLSAVNCSLMKELNTREETVNALREKVATLEECLKSDNDCKVVLPFNRQQPRHVEHSGNNNKNDNDEDTDDAIYLSQLLHGDGNDVRLPTFFSSLADTDFDVPPEKPPTSEISDDLDIIKLLDRYKYEL